MRQSSIRTTLLAGALLAAPAAAVAQAPATSPVPATSPAPAAAAPRSILFAERVAGARPAERQTPDRAAAAADAARMERHVGAGQNAALMVVGAAGIVTGALVGGGAGTAIAVGGAVVGLYGLYRFVR